ncbi:MAG: hypothetical protein AAGH92_12645 [Planctomycetota bacterium]
MNIQQDEMHIAMSADQILEQTGGIQVTCCNLDAQAPDWDLTPSYLLISATPGRPLTEAGRVQFGWRNDSLHARFVFCDTAIVTSASRDNEWHYEMGDTAEWFLQFNEGPEYWEFYATPNGFKSAIRWPGGSRKGLEPWCDLSGVWLETGRFEAGRHSDRFTEAASGLSGWWAEMSVAASFLLGAGGQLEQGSGWRTLVGRYNHRQPSDERPELSCFPPLPRADFHCTDAYTSLRLGSSPSSDAGLVGRRH